VHFILCGASLSSIWPWTTLNRHSQHPWSSCGLGWLPSDPQIADGDQHMQHNLRNLWAKVCQILGECRGLSVVQNLPLLVCGMFHSKVNRAYMLSQIHKNRQFWGPHFRRRVAPTFWHPFSNLAHFQTRGKLRLSSVQWLRYEHAGNDENVWYLNTSYWISAIVGQRSPKFGRM